MLLGCAQEGELPPNIVLVSLDTLRADRLGAYGSAAGLTPNLDRFAGESIVFEAAFAQASETLFSHASVFTSRYPSELGSLDYDFVLPPSEPTLAEVLAAYGYATAAFTGGGHLHPDFGFNKGFQHYQSDVQWGLLYHAVHSMTDWLDGPPTPGQKFLFVHGYDAHPRYLKPPPFGFLHSDLAAFGPAREAIISPMGTLRVVDGAYFPGAEPAALMGARAAGLLGAEENQTQLSDWDLEQIVGAYDGAVAYVDAWFGLLMAELDQRQMLEDTVIVVMSDHGEELGENGVFNHRYSLSEPVLHVPLMIRLPGGEGGGRMVEETVALLDILPTVLKIVGAEPPALTRGQDLLKERQATPAFSEGPFQSLSARSNQGRLTFEGIDLESPHLPHLLRAAQLEGPAFTWSTELEPEAAVDLRDKLLDWRMSLPLAQESGSTLSPEQRQRLREKGYWEPQ